MQDRQRPPMRIGEPIRARIAPEQPTFSKARIACAQQGCPVRIGTLMLEDGLRHAIGLDVMFAYDGAWGHDPVPLVELRPRYAAQWHEARKRGEPWSRFRPRARRARRQDRWSGQQTSDIEAGLDRHEAIPFRFTCPVCRRVSLADFPQACSADCPYHCSSCHRVRLAGRPHACQPASATVHAELMALAASGVAQSW